MITIKHLQINQVSALNKQKSLSGYETSLVCPCVGVLVRMSLIILLFLYQPCQACLDHLAWMVCVMGDKWRCSSCFAECYYQNQFKTVHRILVQFLCSFFFQQVCLSKWCNHTIVLAWLHLFLQKMRIIKQINQNLNLLPVNHWFKT